MCYFSYGSKGACVCVCDTPEFSHQRLKLYERFFVCKIIQKHAKAYKNSKSIKKTHKQVSKKNWQLFVYYEQRSSRIEFHVNK